MEYYCLRYAVARWELERRRWLRSYFQSLGIPLGQGQPRTLECLFRFGPQTQRQLAEFCGIDGSTMSRSLDRLTEAGLVCRREDPGSRRSIQVYLTDRGQEMAEKVAEAFAEEDRLVCQGTSEGELLRAVALLEEMRERLRKNPLQL